MSTMLAFRHHLHGPLKRLLIHDVMRDGHCTQEQAEAAVEKFESEHPLLDRLVNLDWAAILRIVLALLPLFLAAEPKSSTMCNYPDCKDEGCPCQHWGKPKAASVAEQVFGTDV